MRLRSGIKDVSLPSSHAHVMTIHLDLYAPLFVATGQGLRVIGEAVLMAQFYSITKGALSGRC
jgi:hypothetical protein